MTIRIAGTPLAINDALYSRRAAAWGRVTHSSGGAATFTYTKDGTTRSYTVADGGKVAGVRDLYWHEALVLDLPKAQLTKLAKLQAAVNALTEVL